MIAELVIPDRNIKTDIEFDTGLTVNELVKAVAGAFEIEINEREMWRYAFVSLYPAAFLHGNRKLENYGLKDGSCLLFRENQYVYRCI